MRRKYQPSSRRTNNWQSYQNQLQKNAFKKKAIENAPKYACFLLLIIIVVSGITGLLWKTDGLHLNTDNRSAHLLNRIATSDSENNSIPNKEETLLEKSGVQALLGNKAIVNLQNQRFGLEKNGRHYYVSTSLDISLQNFMFKKIDRKTSTHVGIVAMDPSCGRILTMVGYDKTDPRNNPCTDNRFPAASIFKIITAAAAIEIFDYHEDSYFTYNGRKYTLYKSQIEERINRYTNRITLRDSFAQSVNPVFGKIGAFYLGKTSLEKYAHAFGFNHCIEFEAPLPTGIVTLSDDYYHCAKVASGFNRETTLSPLHGALITAAILNEGILPEPTIVDKIIDESGASVYRSHATMIKQAIEPKTSTILNDLMIATIQSGTCKKAFRGYRNDPVLSRLNIGGKSGSISSKKDYQRHDWFVGFAEEKDGSQKVVVSIVVTHDKYIGTRAAQYARMAIKHFFDDYFEGVKLARNI